LKNKHHANYKTNNFINTWTTLPSEANYIQLWINSKDGLFTSAFNTYSP